MSFNLDITSAIDLFSRFGIQAKVFERIPRGVTNPAYLVDDRWVLRVHVREPFDNKFRREQEALILAGQAHIKVPQTVFLMMEVLDLDFLLCAPKNLTVHHLMKCGIVYLPQRGSRSLILLVQRLQRYILYQLVGTGPFLKRVPSALRGKRLS